MKLILSKQFIFYCIASIIMVIIWWAINPYYQYYIDADSTAYLTIAQRYAHKDFQKAINGMWSPLNIWFIVPFIIKGFNGFWVAQFLNIFFSVIILFSFLKMCLKFKINSKNTIWGFIILVPCLIYYSYIQVFGDLLSVCIFLFILNILFSKNWKSNPWKLLSIGVLGAFSYFSKSYNFYYFPLFIFFVVLSQNENIYTKLKIYTFIIISFFITSSPWLYLLYNKYNKFTATISGKLNSTWYLVNTKEFNTKILTKPTFKNSPSYWEDPFYSQSIYHSPFESSKLMVMKIARIAYNMFETINVLNQISFICIVVFLFLMIYILRKKRKTKFLILSSAILTLPIGYLLVHVEARYLWLSGILSLIIFLYFLQKSKFILKNPTAYYIILFTVALSYWAYPMYDLEQIFNKGKNIHELSVIMKKSGLSHLNFTSNIQGGENWKLAYESENYFFDQIEDNVSENQIVETYNRNNIQMYVFYKSINTKINIPVLEKMNFIKVLDFDNTIFYLKKND